MWVHDQLRSRILGERPSLEELYRTRWSHMFERLMRNRLVMGWYRYGEPPFGPGRKYDNIGSASAKLAQYMSSGNMELLVDCANLCLCEFLTRSSNPRATWNPTDDEHHTEQIDGTRRSTLTTTPRPRDKTWIP